MQLTLIVPELIWPEPDDRETFEGLTCRSLEFLLARSTPTTGPAIPLETMLADAFGHPENASFAALRRIGEADDLQPEGFADGAGWVCSDPVHLRFHQDSVILADGAGFDLGLDEAQILISALNDHFLSVGRFHLVAADRWYLQLDDRRTPDRFDAPPLSAVAGRSVERLLLAPTQTPGLKQLLVEAQMLLHAHPVNAQREREDRLPINSLWLWGAGTLAARIEPRFDGVWSCNPLARGLARASGVPTRAVPSDANALIADAAPGTRHLVVLEDLLAAVHYEDGDAYRSALAGPNGLEKRWFAPLRTALANGQVQALRIEASTAYASLGWECSRSDQWKLWRRSMPLGGLAQQLAKEAA